MYPDEYLSREDSAGVYFATQPFEVLSNWSAHAVEIDGEVFPTVDHYYHYRKFSHMSDDDIAKRILKARSPWFAAKIAKEYAADIRNDWADVRVDIMRTALAAKHAQHGDVKQALQRTRDRNIYEVLPHNTYWGVDKDGSGENIEGKIWMEIRES